MKKNRELIQTFLDGKEFAIAGASRDPRKFGRAVFDDLRKKGYTLYPVHHQADQIDGVSCYPDVHSLPGKVKKLLILTPASATAELVKQAGERGIREIWIQQKSASPEALDLAGKHDIRLIHGECIFMYAEPVKGVHKFHRFLSQLFGS